MRVASAATARVGGHDGAPCSSNRAVVAASAVSVANRLRESLAETTRLLEDFEREQQQTADLDTYKNSCRQLVTYMVAQMDTSPDFMNQMEQVIRASYSNSGGFTLSSMVTGSLWVRYSGSSQSADTGAQSACGLQTPARQGPASIKTDTPVNNAVTVTPLAVANASVAGLRPTCSPHVDLTSTPPTVGRVGKRQSKTRESQESKRPRHIVARNLYGAGRLDCEEKDDEDASGLENRCGRSASQLESKMKRLEEKRTKLEDAVAFHKERERTFRDDLHAIGTNEKAWFEYGLQLLALVASSSVVCGKVRDLIEFI
ncbi:uncharacterized protein IUM83_00643 [Phytophthora cinnamomi]|uniref:uncharacterized protein n=1 Tax=Phytophthora cinnamomi TaxID=4785 RepID=UPI00355AB984|nr:hypothetical protein IUM83_00643 [Phytophthora cinnamomi]